MKVEVSCSKCWASVKLKQNKMYEHDWEGKCPNCCVTLYAKVRE